MKNRQTRKNHYSRKTTHSRVFVLIAVVVLLVVIAIFLSSARMFHFWPWPKHPIATNQDANSLPSPKTTHPSPKNNNTPSKDNSQSSVDQGKTSSQIPVSNSMTATITELDESNQQINFAASISNSSMAGTCVITFSNPNDRPVVKQVTATTSEKTATCGPIHVSSGEFSYLGTWQVSLRYYEGSEQATAQSNIDIH